jgi:hypothetical protein
LKESPAVKGLMLCDLQVDLLPFSLCSESLPVDQGHGSVNHEARSIKHPVQSPPNLLYSNSLFSTCPFLTALRRERRVLFGVTWTLKSVSDSSAAALHPRHKEDPANSSLLPAQTGHHLFQFNGAPATTPSPAAPAVMIIIITALVSCTSAYTTTSTNPNSKYR